MLFFALQHSRVYRGDVMTGKEFKAARLRLGLTQKKLGEMIGLLQPNVSRAERIGPSKQQAAMIATLVMLCLTDGKKNKKARRGK